MKIRSLMISDPITVTEKATITDAMEVMKNHSIRHLPVVGEGNVLIGFLTLSDLKQGLIPSLLGEVSLTDLMIQTSGKLAFFKRNFWTLIFFKSVIGQLQFVVFCRLE